MANLYFLTAVSNWTILSQESYFEFADSVSQNLVLVFGRFVSNVFG